MRNILLPLLLCFGFSLNAQITKTQEPKSQTDRPISTAYTTMPIQLPLSMAGGFAEIRSNHFHSGIDIRTGGKEGERVYAPNDGYVSRINISAWGGGKVLYITHPDGFRTVYMHLSEFCGDIGRFVNDYQYAHHTFAFDIELPKDSIPVKKGQLVALTGNTGGSAGPHLHYEIRYAENDQTINPLLFGLPYSDPLAPTIENIKIYPANSSTSINGTNKELFLLQQNTKSKKSTWQDTVTIAGRFYTGIYTYDRMEAASPSKNGVYSIDLYIDGELFHRYSVPTFMFEETRAINAIIDYPQYRRNRNYYIVTRHLRGDRNNFSTAYRDNGYIQFNDNKLHKFQYRVSDHKGNTSTHTFFVRSKPEALLADSTSKGILASGEPITYYKSKTLTAKGFQAIFEPYTVYENDQLVYSTSSDAGKLSKQHRLALLKHPLPPHKPFTVKMIMPENLADTLREKVTIVCINGKDVSALSTKIDGTTLTATSRSFGSFALRLDTVAPTVKPVNFNNGKKFTASTLTVKIADNLSGIVSYSCHINGQWQLAEHDGKTATLNVSAKHLRKGKNTVTFRISDATGNIAEQSWNIIKN